MTTESTFDNNENVSPGQLLSEARQAKSMSQNEVAQKLCLKIQLIQNIENNDFEAELKKSTIYLRGYLRAYARLVEIPEEKVLSAFDIIIPATEPKPRNVLPSYLGLPIYSKPNRQNSSVLGWIAVALVLVLAVVIILSWKDFKALTNLKAVVAEVTYKKNNNPAPESNKGNETSITSTGEVIPLPSQGNTQPPAPAPMSTNAPNSQNQSNSQVQQQVTPSNADQ